MEGRLKGKLWTSGADTRAQRTGCTQRGELAWWPRTEKRRGEGERQAALGKQRSPLNCEMAPLWSTLCRDKSGSRGPQTPVSMDQAKGGGSRQGHAV